MNANELISAAAPGAAVTLPAGEFEGPLVINKPLRLIGRNTTVWAKNSPVIQINSDNVTIEGLRAEITEGNIEEPAVVAVVPANAANVEILGRVSGFGAEDGYFDIPRTIALGEFPADSENTFRLEVNVPADTEISCELREITFEPKTLKAGRNELIIRVNGISSQVFLFGEALFRSQFTRRIYITGKPDANAQKAEMKELYKAPQRDPNAQLPPPPMVEVQPPPAAAPAFTPPAPINVPQPVQYPVQAPARAPVQAPAPNAGAMPKTDVISIGGAQDLTLPPLDMRRGQRVGLTKYVGSKFKILFSSSAPKGYEIDPYVFLLNSADKAVGDEGLIFFGNESDPNECVKYFKEDGHVEVDLSRVPPQVKKIALTYSIYGGNKLKNFRKVFCPKISLSAGGERIMYTIYDLSDETTIVAMEFYLYKGEWKVSAVGAGFKDGLEKLCNHYGIAVE